VVTSRWRSSARFRRRAWSAAGFVVAGAAVAAVALSMQNTGDFPKQRLVDEPADVIRVPKTARLTKHDTADVVAATTRFVRTAVARKHLSEAYDIVGPELRGGMSRAEWTKGDNPVVPFASVGIVNWKLAYSYRNDVGLDLALLAPRGSDVVGKSFRIELRRPAAGKPWRVVSWLPLGLSGAGNVRSIAKQQAQARVVSSGPTLAAWWLLFPVAVLSLVVVVPVALGMRSWRAHRRAQRAYRAQRGAPSEL
jgi:hypothetical protein